MIVNIKIYNAEVSNLLKKLDKAARKYDSAKYGLPPETELEGIVYDWVYKNKTKDQG